MSISRSDGPATGGFQEGEGAALIAFPGGDIREVQVAAGYLCSSTRAEFFALRPALKELSSGEDRAASQPIVVGTESLAVMALLQSDPCARRTPVTADIWSLLRPRARRQRTADLHAVGPRSLRPVRHRASGRPRAEGGSSLPQREIPVEVKTIQSAVMFSVGSSWQQLAGRRGFVRCGGTDARSRSRLIGVSEWTAISYGRTTAGANRRSASGSAVYLRLTARSAAPMSIPPHYASIIEKRLAFLNMCC